MDFGQEYKWFPEGNTMDRTCCRIMCITKAVSWWQVNRTSVQLGEPNGNDGTSEENNFSESLAQNSFELMNLIKPRERRFFAASAAKF